MDVLLVSMERVAGVLPSAARRRFARGRHERVMGMFTFNLMTIAGAIWMTVTIRAGSITAAAATIPKSDLIVVLV